MKKDEVPICEIFFSYQGEGVFTGLGQIFVRFAGCNIRCKYCDTIESLRIPKKTDFINAGEIEKIILDLYKKHKKDFYSKKPFISFTGGEPLCYADFLESFLPRIKKKGFDIYLETNGTLPNQLKKIINFCDIISMDFKFPSQCGEIFWSKHKEFLKIALQRETFIKCVITKTVKLEEIKKAAQIVKEIAPNIFFILQPSLDKNRPELKNLYLFKKTAEKIIPNVLIMPQMHKVYRIS
ncbi:MAG: 7-carboxy-7-deazaguanine synthase QueE [Endomicrobium sp.]|jgi:organic radical activating enzyme|nr:7-carboxy-7-deazaguanine synthase QueE [Endomicrobium sp.]